MLTLNRTALLVRPRQAFLDWLHREDPTSRHLTLHDLRQDSTVYLLPECDDDEATRECLEAFCVHVFEEELDGWIRTPSSWPPLRDFKVFEQWFEWTVHSMVVDLSADPLLLEDL
jgi:hypothetical protein